MFLNKQFERTRISTLAYAVLLSVNVSANASPVYKSVDADGNITYSTIPPKDATDIEKMNVSGTGQSGTQNQANSNIEQMKDLAEELEKDRLQLQGDREAANKKREESQAKKQVEEDREKAEQKAAEPQEHYYPVYVPRPHHPVRPKPGHRPHQRTFP